MTKTLSESEEFTRRVAQMEKWMSSERFKYTTRPYTAKDVVSLQGTYDMHYHPSEGQSKKLYKMLRENQKAGTVSHTFGALDPVQVIEMAPYVETIYISGWQSSSTAATNNMAGPDVADYPYDTVPNKCDQLVRAQLFHDSKQQEERMRMDETWRKENPPIDFMNPIIADADTE